MRTILTFIACLLLCPTATSYSQQSKIQYSTVPISPQTKTIPPSYIGHSPYQVVTNLLARSKRFAKGEFETSSEYQQRVEAEKRLPVIGSVSLNDCFAFYYDDFGLSYLADEGVFHLSLFDEPIVFNALVNLTSQTKKYGSYVGQTALGIKRRVQVYKEVSINLKMPWQGSDKNRLFFPVERSNAMKIKQSIHVLLLVQLQPPFIETDNDVETATINDPRLIAYQSATIHAEYVGAIVYNFQTGEVLYRSIRNQFQPLADLAVQSKSATSPLAISQYQNEGRDYELGMKPTIKKSVKANYTDVARRNGREGKVRLDVLFRADGTIPKSGIQVLQELPDGLTEKAIEAAQQIVFEPPIKDGKKVNTRHVVEYMFSLNQSASDFTYKIEKSNNGSQPTLEIIRPRIISQEKAKYTEGARQNRVEGVVSVSIVLGADGRVTSPHIVRGLPDGLNEEAIKAAQKTRFQPAMKNGQPLSTRVTLDFEFTLP